jgi:hypothetical protein
MVPDRCPLGMLNNVITSHEGIFPFGFVHYLGFRGYFPRDQLSYTLTLKQLLTLTS